MGTLILEFGDLKPEMVDQLSMHIFVHCFCSAKWLDSDEIDNDLDSNKCTA